MPIFRTRFLFSRHMRLTTLMLVTTSTILGGQLSAHADEATLLSTIQSGKVAGFRLTQTDEVAAFYKQRAGKPLWIDNNQFNDRAKDILTDMENSWTQGLNPANYHLPELRSVVHGDDAELLMTDAVIRYARDLSGMRLSAKLLEEDQSSWARGINTPELLRMIAEDTSPATFLRYLAPQDKTYVLLTETLKELIEDIRQNPKDTFKPIPFPGLLRPNTKSQAIKAVREHLGVDLKEGQDPSLYDAELEKVVVEFQIKNGLKPDGLIGRRSFNAINQTREQKIIKVLANLERRRWVHRPLPDRYVAVNIPAMLLRAVDKGEVQFEIPVIVGTAKNQTISFVDEIIGVRFNPSWYVPDTIKAKEYLPQLQKDPNALEKQGIKFRVKSEEGLSQVESKDIDWANMTDEQLKSVQMLQEPGEKNVLGRIRVLMPNRYDIYLHDTSAPALFAKDDRALSHGCVRLSEPSKIANFVLGPNPTWSQDRLDSYLKKDKTIEVTADQSVPVYLFYYTAWLDAEERLIIADDLYGLDNKIVYYLQEAGKLPFKVNVPDPISVEKS